MSTETARLFLGAFQLLSIIRTRDGSTIADITYGEHPAGVISYTSSGFMSAILTASDTELRPSELTLPSQETQSIDHWAEVGKHSLGYAGPFHISDRGDSGALKGEVVHGPLLTATLPSWVGTKQKRKFEFSPDGRHLTLVGDLGNGVVDTLQWQRLEDGTQTGKSTYGEEIAAGKEMKDVVGKDVDTDKARSLGVVD